MSVLAGDPPRGTPPEARPAVEQPTRVHPAGEADERVDRAQAEHEGERVLPQRDADERAAGREHERRRQREESSIPQTESASPY